MNSLMTLAVLTFLAGLSLFVVRGLPAETRLRLATDELDARRIELEQRLIEARPVSWLELSAADDEVHEARRKVDARLTLLLETPTAEPAPDLGHALADTGISALLSDGSLRATVETLGRRDTLTASALARLITALDGQRVFELESLQETAPVPVPGLPQLQLWSAELILLIEVDAALGLLEALTPRPGAPVMSVASASLRRIEPALWPGDPIGLTSPPVRLWLAVEALGRSPEGR